MHWFDITVLAALLVSGLWSLFRGLIREVLSLIGVVAAIVLSVRGYPYLAEALETVIHETWLQQAVAFGLIFIAVMLLTMLGIRVLHLFVSAVGLSPLDRLLGGLFGMAKVVLVVSALFLIGPKFFPATLDRLQMEAVTAPWFVQTAALLTTFLEQHDYDVFKRLYQQGNEARPEATTSSPQPPASPSAQTSKPTSPASKP